MVDFRGGVPLAGWYPDAARVGFARWWDGGAWTEHSIHIATATGSPPSPSAPADLPQAEPEVAAPALADFPSVAVEASEGEIDAQLSRRERRERDERASHALLGASTTQDDRFASSASAQWPPADAEAVRHATAGPPPIDGSGAPGRATGAASETEPETETETEAAIASQLADATPPVVGTAAPGPSLTTGWPVRPELAREGAVIDIGSADHEPVSRSSVPSAAATPHLTRSGVSATTFGAWALALLPLVFGSAAAAVVMLVVVPDPSVLTQPIPLIIGGGALAAGILLWVIVFAALDRWRLASLGHDRRPSILWAILLGPIAYLIARVVALRGSGARAAAPLIGYLTATVLVSVGAGVALGTVAASVVAGSPLSSIESTVAGSLAEQGLNYDVFCPSGIELAAGAVIVCEAHDDLGVAALVEVTVTNPAGAVEYRMI